MTDHFVVDMLPAREGDCLWIEYGDSEKPRRILVDGGRQSAYDTLSQRFRDLPADQRTFELLVCTHVDADHIEGLLKLVEDPDLPVTFKDVWFNGYDHLKKPDGTEDFGARQGERLTDGLVDRSWNWNKAFASASVVVPDDGDPPERPLDGGMTITLLSPTWDKLERLRPVWKEECARHGLIPGVQEKPEPEEGFERFGGLNIAKIEALAASPFKKDASKANGSSIAFIASFGGKSVLLAGDAHADIVMHSLQRLSGGAKTRLDALKLSHHGSKGTVSSDLLETIECPVFLISTDGSRHDHPDREAIARVVTSSPEPVHLIGNYRSTNMLEWDIAALRGRFDYDVTVPDAGHDGITRLRLL